MPPGTGRGPRGIVGSGPASSVLVGSVSLAGPAARPPGIDFHTVVSLDLYSNISESCFAGIGSLA